MSRDEGSRTKLEPATALALRRTLLAHQRTLMAWIRTSASLITFGFTIYKFFEYLGESGSITPPRRLIQPRHFGMGMIFMGVFALALATIDYRREMNELEADYGPVRRSAVGKIAGLISLLGIALFVIVFLRD